MHVFDPYSLVVIERPQLTAGPRNVIGVKEHERVDFQCHFNSSLINYLAECEWLRGGRPASNGNKWQHTEEGFDNHLICGFYIVSVLIGDEGTYSCYCAYNTSFNQQLHIPENQKITSRNGTAVLKFNPSMIIF